MVHKEIIFKSITDAIIKCRTGGSVSTRVKHTFNEFHEQSSNWKKEQAIITNSSGETLYHEKGVTYHVKLLNDDIQILVEQYGGDLHLTHNHPDPYQNPLDTEMSLPTCLSKSDMLRLLDIYRTSKGLVTPFKSISAEYGDMRMTLNRKKLGKDNVVLNEVDKENYMTGGMVAFGSDKSLPEAYQLRKDFDHASSNLVKKYGEFITLIHGKTSKNMQEWNKEWDDKYNKEYLNSLKKGESIDYNKLKRPSNKEYWSQWDKFMKQNSRNDFETFIQDNIQEFDRLGFELTVDWIQ